MLPDPDAALDARLQGQDPARWDALYADSAHPRPFFTDAPDESLVAWLATQALPRGKALDIGCGNGRNAIHLAREGFDVCAVDFSPVAVAWARRIAASAGVALQLIERSVFELEIAAASCQLIYDGGCLHHIAPHRRAAYVAKVVAALAPGGWWGLVCFRPEGGSGLSDEEVYQRGTLGGGLGYDEAALRALCAHAGLRVAELRPMRTQDERQESSARLFGLPLLWSLWAQREH